MTDKPTAPIPSREGCALPPPPDKLYGGSSGPRPFGKQTAQAEARAAWFSGPLSPDADPEQAYGKAQPAPSAPQPVSKSKP